MSRGRAELGWALAAGVTVALAACEERPAPPAPAPPPTPARPPADDDLAPAPDPGLAPVRSGDATAGGADMAEPRPLDEILFELEEIETSPANLDDPEADYEARFVRKEELEREARALAAGDAAAVLPALLERLRAARALPDVVGAREQRPFLCRVLGGLDEERARAAIAAELRELRHDELGWVLAAMPRNTASRGAIAGWFLRQSEFARTTGGGDPDRRALLLEAYLARGPLAPDDEVVAAATRDPSAKVAALARQAR